MTTRSRASLAARVCAVAALVMTSGAAAASAHPTSSRHAGQADHADHADHAGRLHAVCSPAVVLEGFSDHLDGVTADGVPVTGLSALAPSPGGGLLALSDRSVLFRLAAGDREPVAVTPLAGPDGAALDSEGLARDTDGTLWVSSEAGPQVLHLTADGSVLGELDVPVALRVAPAGRAAENQSFEGLTLSADGLTLLAATEGPLAGDAADVVRLQTWVRPEAGSPFVLGAQHALRVDPGLGVPEVLFTPDGRLVVLERGFLAAVGNTVRLYVADPRGAADTSGVAEITEGADDVVLPTALLADLVTCPPSGAAAGQQQLNPLLDNVEGMALADDGPRRGGAPLHLVLVSDDNQRATQTTRLYDLAVTLP